MMFENGSIIDVKDLTKVFNGKLRAVDGITFQVKEREIFGFLGPNGAGKTTTINMLTTLLRPTSGSAVICGYDLHTPSATTSGPQLESCPKSTQRTKT